MQNINNKLLNLVRLLSTLKDEELEKALINRAVLDRIFLMRKSRKTGFELLEGLSFRDLYELSINPILNNKNDI
ncbi:hypothetical protein ACN4FU_00160 [Aliarcobacter butzleri]|uniref:hypothetical protein n=1 Tax=Aliarcobacter butzleri TaxID=28197 RepID=UPI003AF45224